MSYSIIGSGHIGSALARQFARKGIDVGIANARGPESIAALGKELGLSVTPRTLEEALRAGVEGMIRIHGELWGAVSSQEAPEGAPVRVLRIEGLKLYVEPAQSPAVSHS